MFNINAEPSGFRGGITFVSDPSQAFTSHALEAPFLGEEDLEQLRQLGQLNTFSLRSFDPSDHDGNSSFFRALAPASFQSQSDGFVGEVSSYGTLSMPINFYEPAALMNLSQGCGLYDHDCSVFSAMEEVCGRRQLESSSPMESRKRKGAVTEDCGTQKKEKKRRETLGKKFELLKALIPNPTKNDRTTVLSDASNYIKELLRTLENLKELVGRKREKIMRTMKLEMEEEVSGDKESSSSKSNVHEEDEHGPSRNPRSTWFQRRSMSTFVDVRTIEDEVFIKLEQVKRIDCPLLVSRVLDEFQLELMHFSGGNVGNSHVFMISTKIPTIEGSPVYASSVARRLIEVMDG